MREDMAGWCVPVLLLAVTCMSDVVAETEATIPPPDFRVTSSDALVIVHIIDNSTLFKTYNITYRRNGSIEEEPKGPSDHLSHTYIIPPHELIPGQTYCVKASVHNKKTRNQSAFSPEECFTAPTRGPPNNLSVDALDLRYLLKWDWDFDQSPNATFSVEECSYAIGKCIAINGCKNITTSQCYCPGLYFHGPCILRVSVYDRQREERSANVIQFTPHAEVVIGPPEELKMRIIGDELYINVSAPLGFRNEEISSLCGWRNHLEYWINSTHNSEVMVKEDEKPFFKIESLETSTTYCVRAKMRCSDSNRSSLYTKAYCIKTDPRSYLVVWILGFFFLGIVVISVVLYICLCPLKRYMKHIFFPSSNLPSSIEKGLGESLSDCIKHPFLLHEEETMDRCYIVQDSHSEGLVQMNAKNTSNANSQDSGNYSSECQTTGETDSQ